MAIKQVTWTNASVLGFAQGRDPVVAIEEAARANVLGAMDVGWQGPPVNPLALADLLGIPIEADANVRDARAVPNNGGVKIQFNPTQTRERVRFSVAHEVAHTLFPDVAQEVRNRGGGSGPDDWQLEMLCNIGAAEIVMPVGSLPPRDQVPALETLMVERRKYDVSAEAFLIRVVKVATEPLLVFFASPSAEAPTRYRVDYAVPSRGWQLPDKGIVPPDKSILAECTAIGHIARASEVWQALGDVEVECVGIPGYPGSRLRRVAGLARRRSGDISAPSPKIEYVQGDVLRPRGAGPYLVCMLVNDAARRWGGEVARAAASTFGGAEVAFSGWLTSLSRLDRLGSVHFFETSSAITVASLVAQEGYGPSPRPRIRYAALERCLAVVAERAESSATVHMPRLGAGGAGGDWQVVEQIVTESLVDRGIQVVVYDPPPRRAGVEADLFS